MQSEPGAPAPAGAIALCVPEIRGNEWVYIKECLDTNFVSSVGSFVDRFECELAASMGVRFAVATVNGTAALHIALLTAGVQADDEVLVSTLSFIAPANAIRYAGAWPVFIDAEPEYWQMDTAKAGEWLRTHCHWSAGELRNRVTGRRVSAMIPVHILGHPVDMDPLLELAAEFKLAVIEDATESLGAKYRGRTVGALARMACLSFNGNKLLTTGGGGMLLTDDPEIAKRAKYLTTQAKDDSVEFVHGAVGFNYRLTNVQAAMGCAQLEQLDDYLAAKRRIAATYNDAFRGVPGLAPVREAPWAQSALWMYTMLVDEAAFGMSSRALLRRLDAGGIQTRPLWQPLHRSPAHAGAQATDCGTAETLNAASLSLPCSVGLTADEQRRVIAEILDEGVAARKSGRT